MVYSCSNYFTLILYGQVDCKGGWVILDGQVGVKENKIKANSALIKA